MWFPDVNILVYAFNAKSPAHKPCLEWLEQSLAEISPVFFCDITELGLVRISTQGTGKNSPLATFDEAWEFIESLRATPAYRQINAGSGHGSFVRDLHAQSGRTGRHLTDLWLAAMAMEQGATFVTLDKDFNQFEGLEIFNPLKP